VVCAKLLHMSGSSLLSTYSLTLGPRPILNDYFLEKYLWYIIFVYHFCISRKLCVVLAQVSTYSDICVERYRAEFHINTSGVRRKTFGIRYYVRYQIKLLRISDTRIIECPCPSPCLCLCQFPSPIRCLGSLSFFMFFKHEHRH
jgi:hypothetical protein